MASLNGYDATQYDPQSSFEPIPAGWYKVMITASEMKETKRGDGQYLQLRLDIIDGEYENRVLFDRLNINNANRTAVDIANRALSAICHAVGVLQPQDSQELHDIPFEVKVTVKPASGEFEASNEVRGYRAIDSEKPATKPTVNRRPPTGTSAQTSAPAPKKKPWEK